ncbi:hypothetical protein D3C87_127220 [compost metagenome]
MNITYLLGAGASYNALPVVNQISERLKEFRKISIRTPNIGIPDFFSKHGFEKVDDVTSPSKMEVLSDLGKSISWLILENDKHFSIDTFAKKLYLQKDFNNLHKLKITLSCFFVYLQNTGFDNRYDSFFASILDDLKILPPNLKFLSWNYDYQFEIAFSNFIKNKKLSHNQQALNVCSKGIKSPDRDSANSFGIYKLNGTTSLIDNGNNINILDNINEDEIELLNEIVTYYYYSIKRKIPTTLSFAWEEENENYINSVSRCIKNTDILIVIGYSFPFFNRKIDTMLLKSMSKLKKIYIQDPSNSDSIEERIKSLISNLMPIDYNKIKMTDQFYIPFEF